MSHPPPTHAQESAARDLVDQLLLEQQLLTPVADFARKHGRGELGQSRSHRELLPLTPLVPGEQYAFEVELDKCSGCKACVTACHSLNGLDDDETWREVGLLIEAPRRRRDTGRARETSAWLSEIRAEAIRPSTTTSSQHVTTACHHCVDPACLNGCPVLAYDKDPVTGIVRHLDDQCIGCQYCVLKCPYDVPKYNARLGIVRKCDMCSSRLAVGEAPACAQACPNEAIRITKVRQDSVRIEFRVQSANFLSGAPEGDYTLPTTRYVKGDLTRPRDAVQEARLIAADAGELKPQPAHWPLVFMLVLTQASVGAVGATLLPGIAAGRGRLLAASFLFALLGLGASVFHLGRPFGAWRAFLNLKRSWMSREIVVFGIYFGLLVATAAASFLDGDASLLRIGIPSLVLTGVAGVICSAMIYADTQRELWRIRRSVTAFLLTAVLLGAAAALVVAPTNALLLWIVPIAVVAKLAVGISVLRHVTIRSLTPMKKTALLITGIFQVVTFAHVVCIVAGGIGIPVLLSTGLVSQASALAGISLALMLIAELCERYLFFRSVVAPKMPGGMAV